MNLLQLVVVMNKDNSSKNIFIYFNTIYYVFKKIFDIKYPQKLSDINLQEVSPKLDLMDMKFEAHSNNFYLRLYKYSYDR